MNSENPNAREVKQTRAYREFAEIADYFGLEKLVAIESHGELYKDKPVLIVEGEKTADKEQEILGNKYAVISWMGGSSAASKMDWSALSGRDVVIWGDNDVAGVNAVNKISESIKDNKIDVKSLKIIPVRQLGLSIGWDLADKLPDLNFRRLLCYCWGLILALF